MTKKGKQKYKEVEGNGYNEEGFKKFSIFAVSVSCDHGFEKRQDHFRCFFHFRQDRFRYRIPFVTISIYFYAFMLFMNNAVSLFRA